MIQQIRSYGKGHLADIVLIFIAGIVQIASMLTFIWSSKQLIDIATNARQGNFRNTVVLMVTTISAQIFLSKWTQSRTRIVSTRIQNTMRGNLFNHLIKTVWQGREKHHSGDTMNRLERDVQNIADFIATELPTLSITVIQFAASFLFLFNLDHRIALLMVGVVPVFILLSRLYYKKMKKLTHEVRQTESNIQSYLQESIQNKLVLKTHQTESSISAQLNQKQTTLLQHTERYTRVSQWSRTITSLGFSFGYITVFVYGAYQLQSGNISYGIMIAFLQLVGQIQRPVMRLTGLVSRYISAITAAERLSELEQIPEEKQGSDQFFIQPCGIRIDKVKFFYDKHSRTVINNLSFDFTPGSRTAIIGETGAGKTTLLRLFLSLVTPCRGTVEIYSEQKTQPVSPLTRCNFIYVPQGNTLISGSIRENLLLGNPQADDPAIQKVLHTACAEFAHNLPQGIDTICGEKGGSLSEGQAQRIAIARALLGKGNILLFDESTSALDHRTEQEIMKRLKAEYPAKTLIFITHRQGIIEYCDQTLLVKKAH